MIVVADASPIIFLGKIDRLDLIHGLFQGEVRLPASVRDEILAPPLAPAEERILQPFLERCRIEPVARPRRFAAAMSRADHDALTLAVRCRADLLLADDRLMREMARVERIRPMGTLGILLRARDHGILPTAEARRLVDTLIRHHGFRIGIEVYEAVLARLALRA